MTKNNLKIVKTDDKKQKELKEKSKSLEAAISQIDQNFGKGSVMRLGSTTSFRCRSYFYRIIKLRFSAWNRWFTKR